MNSNPNIQSDFLKPDFLVNKGFKLIEKKEFFESINMPFYTKNGICLFFNEEKPDNERGFMLGFSQMRAGKYHAVAIKWIDKISQLSEDFKTLTGESL